MEPPPLPKNRWTLTQGAFDLLLAQLDTDRQQAGTKYEALRRKLVKFFQWRGCSLPEDLADDTINRVARRVEEIAKTYERDPALYFYGVVNKILLEQLKKQKPLTRTPVVPAVNDFEQEYVCLERGRRSAGD